MLQEIEKTEKKKKKKLKNPPTSEFINHHLRRQRRHLPPNSEFIIIIFIANVVIFVVKMSRLRDSAIELTTVDIPIQGETDNQELITLPSSSSFKVQEPRLPEQPGNQFCKKFYQFLFHAHFIIIGILIIALIIRGIVDFLEERGNHRQKFYPQSWYLPLATSTACSEIIGFLWQFSTRHSPSRTMRAAFWLSPLLTCGAGVLLIAIGSAGGLAAGVVALVVALVQSLYACWVNPRFDYATRILSLSVAFPPARTTFYVTLSLLASFMFSCICVAGIGGATTTATKLDTIFILVILLSLTWTMHMVKNIMQVVISHIRYTNFVSGTEIDTGTVFQDTVDRSMGSVGLGSILVPILGTIRGSARAMSSVAGGADEFMFSCANCYSGVASRLVTYGNRWAFVQVGVHNKSFVQASVDTWEMFKRAGMEELIDSDLTGSFCFFCGLVGGAICTIVGGSWALASHKDYATEVSIYAFLIGYFMSRIAMAWPQACVSAYYVAYAKNPLSLRFDSTIPDRIQWLQRFRE